MVCAEDRRVRWYRLTTNEALRGTKTTPCVGVELNHTLCGLEKLPRVCYFTRMRLTITQIDKIAALVMKKLSDEKLLVFKAAEEVVLKRIHTAILDDLKAEDELDREVEQLLKDHSAEIESGSVDYRRIFSMIKGKLVRERDLII